MAKSDVIPWSIDIHERECKDAKLWLFGPTFLETRTTAGGTAVNEDNTAIFTYIMHEGMREVGWVSQTLDAGNSYSHNASDCLNCEVVGDGTDDVLADDNDCGDVKWRIQTKFDTGVWTDVPVAQTGDWPFYNLADRDTPVNVDTTNEKWEGNHIFRITLYYVL